MEEADADAKIAEQTKAVEDILADVKLKAKSVKTKKGNIKVTVSANKAGIKAITDMGYAVKYKFYRSTKKTSSYKGKLENTTGKYTNTSGKKGTRYYYKARLMVYDAKGKLVAKTELKQCSYASRIK